MMNHRWDQGTPNVDTTTLEKGHPSPEEQPLRESRRGMDPHLLCLFSWVLLTLCLIISIFLVLVGILHTRNKDQSKEILNKAGSLIIDQILKLPQNRVESSKDLQQLILMIFNGSPSQFLAIYYSKDYWPRCKREAN